MNWTIEYLTEEVEDELQALPADMKAKFLRIVELIKASGLERVHEPYVKHIKGKLWEMRMTGRDGISRAFYVAASGRRVVIVRVFIKKTQKTPQREIRLALKRAEEVT